MTMTRLMKPNPRPEESESPTTTTTTTKSRGLESKIFLMLFGLVALVAVVLLTDEEEVLVADVELEAAEVTHKKATPHTSSGFGGIHNVGQPGGAKAARNGDHDHDAHIFIPTSNVGHAVPSLNHANQRNLWGHYVHDEHRSPYASHLYDKTKEFLDQQQVLHEAKMTKVREEWGAWNMHDPAGVDYGRTLPDFHLYDYRDIPREEFPPDAWQSDPEYLEAFFKEARGLVTRIQEGIYAEYGSPHQKQNSPNLTQAELEERNQKWKIHLYDNHTELSALPNQGLAKLSKAAWEGLVRKLLHSMITHDQFYVVLAGHSAAAGHGNNFQQNRVITFHRLMEPVFDKLGMQLVSRNMGMGGVGTLHFSLGGGDLYGEADIMEWDSGMTEKGPPVDFFNKQAILSGERLPVLITDYPFNVLEETNNTAWMGQYINDYGMIPPTTLENQDGVPFAARWLDGKDQKYNAICWEPRRNVEPKWKQAEHPGSQVSWHPGWRFHQWQGRKLAMIVLAALQEAINVWEGGLADEGSPLPDSYWHVGERYKVVRQALRTHITTPKAGAQGEEEDVRSDCEKMLPWMPRVCRVQMHGFGMWQPRVHTDKDLLNIIQPAPNGYKPYYPPNKLNVYQGFDVMPYNQAVPEGDVDVHAIAIATRYPAPDLDHSWVEDEKEEEPADEEEHIHPEDGTETPPTRRWLRRATQLAVQKSKEQVAQVHPISRQLQNETESSNPESETAPEAPSSEKSEIVPGRGWEVYGQGDHHTTDGLCDGSAQSECSRNAGSDCLIHGHNDQHVAVHGNAMSGWLVVKVPKVKEGIILIRMEWWCGTPTSNKLTVDWTEVNDGKTYDTTPWNQTRRTLVEEEVVAERWDPEERRLKATPDQVVPKDLEMDIAINGKITKTMDHDEWLKYIGEPSKNCAVWPIMDDVSMAEKDWDGEPVEVAVRYRSKEKPTQSFCISHVYYA